jgi:hypothetical protein
MKRLTSRAAVALVCFGLSLGVGLSLGNSGWAADQKAGEKKPTEKKPTEKKPTEKKPTEKKPTGKKPDASADRIDLAESGFQMTVPDAWQRKQPKSNIVEHEFEIPAATGDEQPGRLTVMGAGGSIEDNIKRWQTQFRPDEGASEVTTKVDEKKVAGQKVTVVDLSGTYVDKPGGPFAPGKAINRENYRMLAAIIETTRQGKKTGNYFIKLVGPRQTLADNQEAFDAMIDSLKQK